MNVCSLHSQPGRSCRRLQTAKFCCCHYSGGSFTGLVALSLLLHCVLLPFRGAKLPHEGSRKAADDLAIGVQVNLSPQSTWPACCAASSLNTFTFSQPLVL